MKTVSLHDSFWVVAHSAGCHPALSQTALDKLRQNNT